MQPGEVVRFRMLNGCSDNLMPIVVEGHEMLPDRARRGEFPGAAADPAPAAGTDAAQVLLAPANRAEFLIKGAPRPGVYRMRQLAQSQQFLGERRRRSICEIEVAGAEGHGAADRAAAADDATIR